MKFKHQGTVFNLGAAKAVRFDEKDQILYVSEYWDAGGGRGVESILSGEPAKRIWELYSQDAHDLDAEFSKPAPTGDSDESENLDELLK